MSEDRSTANFLDAEEQVIMLVGEIERLQSEMRHYSLASQSLDAAVERFEPLSDRFADAAATLQDVAVRLREIGTPELLKGQQDLHADVNTLKGSVDQLASMLQQLCDLAQSLDERAAEHHRNHNSSIGNLDQRVKGIVPELNAKLTSISNGMRELETAIETQNERLEKSVNQLNTRFNIVMGGAAVTVFLLLCVGMFTLFAAFG